jgi:DNA-binding NarL/FixJ family response regulator
MEMSQGRHEAAPATLQPLVARLRVIPGIEISPWSAMAEHDRTPMRFERARTLRTELARTTVRPNPALALTPSEQRVADLAASGGTNRDIAATLCITIKTVEHNLSRVYAKLGIRSRAELGRRMDQLAAKQ